jgi:hypothetical protein
VARKTDRPDLAEALLDSASRRQREGFVSGGTAVASVKELTLCTILAHRKWHLKQQGKVLPDRDPDATGKIKIAVGTAMGLYVNPDPELRWEIPSPYGPISGRTDLMDVDEDGTVIPAELKMTWSKMSYGSSGQYVEQLAGYVIAQSFKDEGRITGPRKGRLYVGYVAGDWGYRLQPVFTCEEFEFSEAELSAYYTEELVRKTKAKLSSARPSFADHYKWECKLPCPIHVSQGGDCPGEDGKDHGCFFIIEEN